MTLYRQQGYQGIFFPLPDGFGEGKPDFVEAQLGKILVVQDRRRWIAREVEGVAAVFLCRHFLELALKYTLFHSRWLRDDSDRAFGNAPSDEAKPVEPGHNPQKLWGRLSPRLGMPSVLGTGLDLEFVARFVKEFEKIARNGTRFRYPTKIAVAAPDDPRPQPLGTSFGHLLNGLDRVHDVLEALDTHLVEQYGQNEEWESGSNGVSKIDRGIKPCVSFGTIRLM